MIKSQPAAEYWEGNPSHFSIGVLSTPVLSTGVELGAIKKGQSSFYQAEVRPEKMVITERTSDFCCGVHHLLTRMVFLSSVLGIVVHISCILCIFFLVPLRWYLHADANFLRVITVLLPAFY